ncbi:MAG: aldo/keto reductase [Rudaea sp.]
MQENSVRTEWQVAPGTEQPAASRKLGRTDVRIPPLGIGCWAWGDRLVWGYGSGTFSDGDLREAFDASIEGGVNFFDTAEVYGFGRSEKLLGRFIREANQPVVVATKFAPLPWRLTKRALRDALERSLKRLGLERVDLYQVHFPVPPVSVETWADGLAGLVEVGLTRAVGVSNYSTLQMRRAHAVLAERGIPLASNQVKYSLLDRTPERIGLLDACRELGVTLIAYSPLEQGLVTGKYSAENPPQGVRARRFKKRYSLAAPVVARLKEIGERHGRTPDQVALNWIICKGAVPIPGVKNARQTRQNLGALGWQLAPDEVKALDEIAPW